MYFQRYFFDKGLRFFCQECGKCCTGEPGVIRVTQKEIDEIAKHLSITPTNIREFFCFPYEGVYTIREHEDGRCFFYEKGCKIYPVRPRQCRSFPFWINIIRSKENWDKASKDCPGIGQGRMYSKEEIVGILKNEK